MKKVVFSFGSDGCEGVSKGPEVLGRLGRSLVAMASDGIPIPPGFVISVDAHEAFVAEGNSLSEELKRQIRKAVGKIEQAMGCRFGDSTHPLLLSVRSSLRQSAPGMRGPILNLGLNEEIERGIVARTGNQRFAWELRHRFLSDVADSAFAARSWDECDPADLTALRKERDAVYDDRLPWPELQKMNSGFQKVIERMAGRCIPDDPWEQLWLAVAAGFNAWMSKRAVAYRRIEEIPDQPGPALVCQAMVFGNIDERSATGVLFSRNPATGTRGIFGEWLEHSQGDEVVAGLRTPGPITTETANGQNRHLPSLQQAMPDTYSRLINLLDPLERGIRDAADIEFVIQEGTLWILDCHPPKRTLQASVKIARDLLDEGIIDAQTAVARLNQKEIARLPDSLAPEAIADQKPVTKGFPAASGCVAGEAVFELEAAAGVSARNGKPIFLGDRQSFRRLCDEMNCLAGILTIDGGRTSHEAIFARGRMIPCVAGANSLKLDPSRKSATVQETGIIIREGDGITIDGNSGNVYLGCLPMVPAPEIKEMERLLERAGVKGTKQAKAKRPRKGKAKP